MKHPSKRKLNLTLQDGALGLHMQANSLLEPSEGMQLMISMEHRTNGKKEDATSARNLGSQAMLKFVSLNIRCI
jgi:hypothetical protein